MTKTAICDVLSIATQSGTPESSRFRWIWTLAPAPEPDPAFAAVTGIETFSDFVNFENIN
jgi:hypothetical protein